jgi:DNA-binding NarL/FixJ family response regulator
MSAATILTDQAIEEVLTEPSAPQHRNSVALVVATVRNIVQRLGELTEAARRFEKAAIGPESADHPLPEAIHRNEVDQLAGDLEQVTAHCAANLTRGACRDSLQGLLSSLAMISQVAVERRQLVLAADIFGAAIALAEMLRAAPLLAPAQNADDMRIERAAPFETALTSTTVDCVLTTEELVSEAVASDNPLGEAALGDDLSPRERDVLRLLASGMTDRQIADALYISPRTATTHVKRIRSKLGVHSRCAATSCALRLGLV